MLLDQVQPGREHRQGICHGRLGVGFEHKNLAHDRADGQIHTGRSRHPRAPRPGAVDHDTSLQFTAPRQDHTGYLQPGRSDPPNLGLDEMPP